MRALPAHPRLKLLLEFWQAPSHSEAGPGRLASLIGRDLEFFNSLLKDSFVARGPARGPFQLSFVGTTLEAHFGRMMSGLHLGACFGSKLGRLLEEEIPAALESGRPLLATLSIRSSLWPGTLAAEVLCLPEARGEHGSDLAEATIFAAWAIDGAAELPPEPRPFELTIEGVELIEAGAATPA